MPIPDTCPICTLPLANNDYFVAGHYKESEHSWPNIYVHPKCMDQREVLLRNPTAVVAMGCFMSRQLHTLDECERVQE
jgi:hypothetical protein